MGGETLDRKGEIPKAETDRGVSRVFLLRALPANASGKNHESKQEYFWSFFSVFRDGACVCLVVARRADADDSL